MLLADTDDSVDTNQDGDGPGELMNKSSTWHTASIFGVIYGSAV